jgi:hypothetical protein
MNNSDIKNRKQTKNITIMIKLYNQKHSSHPPPNIVSFEIPDLSDWHSSSSAVNELFHAR